MDAIIRQLPGEIHALVIAGLLLHIQGNGHLLIMADDEEQAVDLSRLVSQITTRLLRRRCASTLECNSTTTVQNFKKVLLDVRNTDTVVLCGLDQTTTQFQLEVLEIVREGRFSMDAENTIPATILPTDFMWIAIVAPSATCLRSQQLVWGLQRNLANRFTLCASASIAEIDSQSIVFPASTMFADPNNVAELRKQARSMHISPDLRVYLGNLLTAVKSHPLINPVNMTLYASAKPLLSLAAVWATLQGESFLQPEHILAVFVSFVSHRIRVKPATDLFEVCFLHHPLDSVRTPKLADTPRILAEIMQSV